MNEQWPDYDSYQQNTDREIPIVVLERTLIYDRRARVVKLVKTADLKSQVPKGRCGFEPRPGHAKSPGSEPISSFISASHG